MAVNAIKIERSSLHVFSPSDACSRLLILMQSSADVVGTVSDWCTKDGKRRNENNESHTRHHGFIIVIRLSLLKHKTLKISLILEGFKTPMLDVKFNRESDILWKIRCFRV